jgi:hypothetical protein
MKYFIINYKTAHFLSKFREFSLVFPAIVVNGYKKSPNAKIFSSKPNI